MLVGGRHLVRVRVQVPLRFGFRFGFGCGLGSGSASGPGLGLGLGRVRVRVRICSGSGPGPGSGVETQQATISGHGLGILHERGLGFRFGLAGLLIELRIGLASFFGSGSRCKGKDQGQPRGRGGGQRAWRRALSSDFSASVECARMHRAMFERADAHLLGSKPASAGDGQRRSSLGADLHGGRGRVSVHGGARV